VFIAYNKVVNNISAPLGRLFSFDKQFKEKIGVLGYLKELPKQVIVVVFYTMVAIARRLLRNCFYSP
jgi:hypothetical protein